MELHEILIYGVAALSRYNKNNRMVLQARTQV